MIDVNYWKTFLYNRLHTQYPEKGAMVVYGKATNHDLFFAHTRAEYGVKVEAKGRVIYEWSCKPNQENDFHDTKVYGLVAASMTGSKLNRGKEKKPAPARTRKKSNFATSGIRSSGGGFANNY